MKYIKKVHLQNFQSHKNTIVEFDRGLNIIVGASDSGKTSILRGIKWALYNDPSGDYFIREGESESSVSIYFSDKTKIKRYRSKSKNTYFVYDKDDNEIKYEGFGTNVPEEVLNVTGIKKILLDKDTAKSINISDQLEGAFLLSEKNSIKANSIGYLVGVDVIDDALRDTLKDSRNLSIQEKNIDEDIRKLKEELLEYEYLEELNLKLKKINEVGKKISSKTKALDIYKRILDTKLSIEKEKLTIKYYLDKLKHLEKIELTIQKSQLKYTTLKILSNYNINFKKVLENKVYNKSLIDSLKNIGKLDLHVKTIDALQNKQELLTKENIKLRKNIREKEQISEKLSRLTSLNLISKNVLEIENNTSELRNLNKLKERQNRVSTSLNKGKDYYKKLEKISLSEEKYNVLNNKMKRLNAISKLNSNYIDNKVKKDKCSKYIVENKEIIETLSVEYKQMLLSQKTCPLCFSEIDNEKADYIINHYK